MYPSMYSSVVRHSAENLIGNSYRDRMPGVTNTDSQMATALSSTSHRYLVIATQEVGNPGGNDPDSAGGLYVVTGSDCNLQVQVAPGERLRFQMSVMRPGLPESEWMKFWVWQLLRKNRSLERQVDRLLDERRGGDDSRDSRDNGGRDFGGRPGYHASRRGGRSGGGRHATKRSRHVEEDRLSRNDPSDSSASSVSGPVGNRSAASASAAEMLVEVPAVEATAPMDEPASASAAEMLVEVPAVEATAPMDESDGVGDGKDDVGDEKVVDDTPFP